MMQHSTDAYAAGRERAAYIDRSGRGRIVVSGADRASYLHGLLTNDIAALKPGQGCYAAYLTPQGRMITDLWVYELGDVMLVVLSRDVMPAVLSRLEQFVFTEDVQLRDVTSTFACITVVGPAAAAAVADGLDIDATTIGGLPEHGNTRTHSQGAPAIVTRVTDAGVAGFDVFVEESSRARLVEALDRSGIPEADASTAEILRVEAGVPLFHRDMDEETIPLEAGIEERAISMTKGCYVGQEVIVRVLHRGHGRVARRLVGLVLEGNEVPSGGAPVRSGAQEVGRVTSAVMSPALGRPIALAYVQRDFVAPGTAVTVAGVAAQVTAVPFT